MKAIIVEDNPNAAQVIETVLSENDLDVEVRKAAVWKLTDKELVASIANHDKDERVRHVALLKIKHPSFNIEKEIPHQVSSVLSAGDGLKAGYQMSLSS